MTNKISSKKLVLITIFLSGFTGLSYQVIWQRYLTFLVGAEARSIALTVGVFLAGLAFGYEYWGRVTLKRDDRKSLRRLYALIEIGIGIYGIAFPYYFKMVETLSSNLPSSVLIDFIYTNLLMLPSSFLMGATVPLVTAFLSDHNDEVNNTHTSIYSINTIGAFLGVVVASIYGVPELGLKNLSLICGTINICLGLFLIMLPIDGKIHRAEEKFELIKHNLSNSTIYLFSFITGSLSLSLEVILVRLLGLSVGSSVVIFPIVLGTVILGLGLGSFFIRKIKITMPFFTFLLFGCIIYFCAYYFLIPYWPYWMNNIRVSMVTIPSNFIIYYLCVSLLFACLTLPLIIPMGIFLPVAYALLNKNDKNYGKICGRLYFVNTIGSLFGAIILGYLSLNFIDIDDLLKCLILLLFTVICLVYVREKKFILLGLLVGLLALFLGNVRLDRSSHYIGLFRKQSISPFNLKGIFQIPSLVISGQTVEFFRDDPNSTVTVLNYPPQSGKSLIVNGKSDGYTAPTDEDYPTMLLLASIPYLHHKSAANLKAVIIGLGTGISAGFTGLFENIERVDVLEISPAVIEANEIFSKDNFSVVTNPKIFIHEQDAFKFFRKQNNENKKIDFIISEPSNPWVMGVENLYTDEFYKLASERLNADGMLMQWLHVYSMSREGFLLVLKNLKNNFHHSTIFQLSSGDIGILASNTKLGDINDNHFKESKLNEVHRRIKLQSPRQISMIAFIDDGDIENLAAEFPLRTHNQNTPILSHLSLNAFFLEKSLLITELYHAKKRRTVAHPYLEYKFSPIENNAELIKNCKEWKGQFHPIHCKVLYQYQDEWNNYSSAKDIFKQLKAYHILREAFLIPANLNFLKGMEKELTLKTPQLDLAVFFIADQLSREGDLKESKRFIDQAVKNQFLTTGQAISLHARYPSP